MRRDNSEDDIPNNNWVLNSVEGIDTPGEWASVNGTLYLWPASGTEDIYVPQLTELIRIDAGGNGNPGQALPFNTSIFRESRSRVATSTS